MRTSVTSSQQQGRANPALLLAGAAVVLLVLGMLYITLQDDSEPAEPAAGMVERESTAPAPAAATVTTPAAAAATAPQGDFTARQLPPYQPTVPAADSPRLAPADERSGDGVVISGQLLEQLEKEAEDTEAAAGAVQLSPPQ